MACKKPRKGAKRETFFPQSPNPQERYEIEKAAALVSQFPPTKPDPDETT